MSSRDSYKPSNNNNHNNNHNNDNDNPNGPIVQTKRHSIWLPSHKKRVGGVITVTYHGQTITARYHAAKMEVILLLNRLRKLDRKKDKPRLSRGWRGYEDLIPFLAKNDQLVSSLQRTVCMINSEFEDAAREVLPGDTVPQLIDTARSYGVHLHWPFRLQFPEQHTAKGKPRKREPQGGV
jgi:hypothetical protein